MKFGIRFSANNTLNVLKKISNSLVLLDYIIIYLPIQVHLYVAAVDCECAFYL
jgi:hypothetical protein